MRRVWIPLLAMVVAGGVAACDCGSTVHQVGPEIERYFTGPDSNVPAIEQYQELPDSDELSLDFGMVDVNTISRLYLLIRNQGEGDLVLASFSRDSATSQDFHIGCLVDGTVIDGCLAGGVPLRVAPGRDLIVEVTYVPLEEETDSGGFTLGFNTTQHASIHVSIAGRGVTREIQVCIADCTGDEASAGCSGAAELCNEQVGKDNLIIQFGDTPMEVTASRRIVIRNLGERELRIAALPLESSDGRSLALDLAGFTPPQSLFARTERTVFLKYHPAAGGDHTGMIRVLSDDLNEPEIQILVTGRGVAPRACPEPLELDFGSVRVGDRPVKSFAIRSCGLQTLRVQGLSLAPGSSPDFTLFEPPALPVDVPVGEALAVQVQYAPARAGSDIGGVDIFSNDFTAEAGTGYTGTVVLKGRSDETYCDIVPEPMAVNFGVVNVDDTPRVDLVLRNAGNQDCVLNQVTITRNTPQNEFSLPQPPSPNSSIAPAGTMNVSIDYHPVNLGQDTGILSVFCNDKDTNEVKVDLNGFAKPSGNGPVAVCTVTPAQAAAFDTLTWRGDQSYDPDGRTITTYTWSIVSFPAGSSARLLGVGPNRTTQTDLAGNYTAQLVVQNDLGQSSQPCTATATVIPSQDLWIEMYWQHVNDDMDLHLLKPNGIKRTQGDCYFSNCIRPLSPDWGVIGVTTDNPHLDLDDIPGDGPENINIAAPANGLYTVFVHDYPGSEYTGANHVTVNVYISGQLKATFERDISGEDTDWMVCTVDWPSGVVTPL